MKKLIFAISALVIIVAVVNVFSNRPADIANTNPSPAPVVGGDNDMHGCKASAGYSWCAAANQCQRSWETYCTAATPKKVSFACAAGKSIEATFYPSDDKFVDLVMGEMSVSLPRAVSASGARYAKADESLVFWNKGETAFVTEGVGAAATTTFKDCVLIR